MNQLLSKELCMRGVSRVNEGVETSAVSTGRHSIAIMRGCRLDSLGLSSGDLGSLNWDSLRLNLLRLNSLRLGNRAARELSGIGIVLEVKMSWVSRVHKRIEVRSLLSRLSWLDRGKLLALDRGWSWLDRSWSTLDRSWSALAGQGQTAGAGQGLVLAGQELVYAGQELVCAGQGLAVHEEPHEQEQAVGPEQLQNWDQMQQNSVR